MTGAAVPRRILIVDDDPDLATILAEVLTKAGYRTAVAENGQQALARLQSEHGWDLVLLDLMMPVMNGWEFRAEQLQQPAIADIPVVAFSGGVNPQQAAVALGAAAALRKPVGRDELLGTVGKVLETRSAGPQ
jgi:CheY-like chemotaxis protein